MAFTFKLQDTTEYLLTQNPSRRAFQEAPVDDTVKSKADGGGYVMTLSRATREVYTYRVIYGALTDTNIAMIKAVHDSCGGAEWFFWTHPLTAEVKIVRFDTRPTFEKPYLSRSKVSFTLQDI